jgi:palmitoyltransferase ZDHHC4
MELSTSAIGILTGYALVMAMTFYWCVIADTKTTTSSPMIQYMTQTLPTMGLQLVGDIVGERILKILETILEKLFAIIYILVVVGCYLTLVIVSYPKARASSHVPEYHLIHGHIIFVVAIGSWIMTMTTSPGIITPETLQYYNHYPYDDLLYVEGRHDKATGIPRLARSKYDRIKYHRHVPRFDHYCGWVGSTIGEENYRLFLAFVLVQLVMCSYATFLLTMFFQGDIHDQQLWEITLFDRLTGMEYQVTKWIMIQFLVDRHVCEVVVFVIVSVMSCLLAYFLGYHVYITSKGMTTNEHYKWGTYGLVYCAVSGQNLALFFDTAFRLFQTSPPCPLCVWANLTMLAD